MCWATPTTNVVEMLASSRFTEKAMTARALSGYLPRRALVKGNRVMVKRKPKFHHARLSLWPEM
jgi:formyltetrahydrofolate hydrolase